MSNNLKYELAYGRLSQYPMTEEEKDECLRVLGFEFGELDIPTFIRNRRQNLPDELATPQ